MAKYFTISELSRSTTATSRGIDNTPSTDAKAKLEALIDNLLDPIRAKWGAPITVNSGFRSPVLNESVGGVATSQHVKGEAVDITTGSPSENKKLFNMIVNSKLPFDQLIDEKGYRWLHISYSTNNRNQILHLK